MKRSIEITGVAAGLVLASAGAASAGEVGGNGSEVHAPDHAASDCAFSGLDTQDAPAGPETNPPGRNDDALAERGNQSAGGVDRYHGVQSYGTFVRAGLKGVVPSPGRACNGSGG